MVFRVEGRSSVTLGCYLLRGGWRPRGRGDPGDVEVAWIRPPPNGSTVFDVVGNVNSSFVAVKTLAWGVKPEP